MPVKTMKPAVKKNNRPTPEQRAVRLQRILFSALAVIMILAMLMALIAR
jgi:hypothetical protein